MPNTSKLKLAKETCQEKEAISHFAWRPPCGLHTQDHSVIEFAQAHCLPLPADALLQPERSGAPEWICGILWWTRGSIDRCHLTVCETAAAALTSNTQQ